MVRSLWLNPDLFDELKPFDSDERERDFHDPDFMFQFGAIGGKGIDMERLRPVVIKAQALMKSQYDAAFEAACRLPGSADIFEALKALPEYAEKVRQPEGPHMGILQLYGALGMPLHSAGHYTRYSRLLWHTRRSWLPGSRCML